MLLDNHTLLFSLFLTCAMMAFSLAVASWGGEPDGLKKWSGAVALEASAWSLIGLRGLAPDVLTVGLASILLVTAQAMKLAAIHEYRRLDWPRVQCLLPVALAMLLLVALPYEDMRNRMIYGSLLFMAQMLMIARILVTDADSRAGRAWWLLFGATLAILPLFTVRALAAYSGALQFSTPQSALAPNPVQLGVFVGLIGLSMLGSMGFILMVKERADRAIRTLAMTDSLTGVFNRRAFLERAEREFGIARRNATPLALLMLDIDYFKQINDKYGHPSGDAVLTGVARILDSRLRKQDTLGRYGGEEFCILLPATGQEGALALAENLRAGVEKSTLATMRDSTVAVTVSIGVTVCPADCATCGKTFQGLVDDADAALYQAKRDGRNRVVALPIACTGSATG